MIYGSIYVCTSMCLYTVTICADGMAIGMCLCVLLAAGSLVYCLMNGYCIVMCIYCASMQILYRYIYIYVLTHIILYHYIVPLSSLTDTFTRTLIG